MGRFQFIMIAACVVVMGASAAVPADAAELLGSYQARLSGNDHFNSAGERLTSAAAIIRQDRANFHKFGVRDPEDEGDPFFSDANNRARLESMLSAGRATSGVLSDIVNGTPLIEVNIYHDFIDVKVR